MPGVVALVGVPQMSASTVRSWTSGSWDEAPRGLFQCPRERCGPGPAGTGADQLNCDVSLSIP
jgi:hypothetical protein